MKRRTLDVLFSVGGLAIAGFVHAFRTPKDETVAALDHESPKADDKLVGV